MYEIFLIDSSNQIKLDTDDLDLTTSFLVADIADITVRKDTITKTVVFKQTKQNNIAFGNSFHLNKVTDTTLANKIGSNFSALRPVDCVVYENGMLILKGTLRLTAMYPNYSTIITGQLLEFVGVIKEKLLSDLDFSDLKHRYIPDNIRKSWNYATENFDVATSTFYSYPFELGRGYVYPHIDYGQQFLIADSNATNADKTIFHAGNYRPAVFVNEYLKHIFSQDDLNGWSYEVKGDEVFKKKFNSAIIPYSDEKVQYKFSGFNQHFQTPFVLNETNAGALVTKNKSGKLVNISSYTIPPAGTINPFIIPQTERILFVQRTITADCQLGVLLNAINNPYYIPIYVSVQLVERVQSSSTNQIDGWNPIADQSFLLNPHQAIPTKTFTFNIAERTFAKNTNLAVRIYSENPTMYVAGFPQNPVNFTYQVAACDFYIPKDANTPFTAEINLGTEGSYDVIAPQAPENIKQLDFLKSVMSLFNLYAYTKHSNPKHFIFEKYDDFYALANPAYIKNNSLNWTGKVDLASLKLKPNLNLPKTYQFSYKEDNDWLNIEYKKNHGITFGNYEYTDAFGIVDAKKIELAFSPTPIVEPVGTGRKMPAFYTNDSGNKKSLKTNIRILYYNGIQPCNTMYVLKDKFNGTWITEEVFPPASSYPQATTYFYDSTGKPIEDLSWGRSKEYFCIINEDYLNLDFAYGAYYRNQITEMTNVNLMIIEANIKLDEIDISNLNLKTPVFIDLGENGHGYFKVLEVEYQNSELLSKVTLQKIYNGTLS
jgi:hypothetical protein